MSLTLTLKEANLRWCSSGLFAPSAFLSSLSINCDNSLAIVAPESMRSSASCGQLPVLPVRGPRACCNGPISFVLLSHIGGITHSLGSGCKVLVWTDAKFRSGWIVVRLVRVFVHMCPERLTQHSLKTHDKVKFVSMLKDFTPYVYRP